MKNNAPRFALLLIILLAFALRVYRLDAQSLWYDEAVTAQVAKQGIAELTHWTADDIQPPLYYYTVAGWTRLCGRGEWALRFPSVFFGLLTVPTLWAVARRLLQDAGGDGGQLAALAVALLAALSPLYVYYSQEARMYTLLTFLGALAGYALLRAMTAMNRNSALIWWAIFVLAGVAMLYTHYFGAFLLLAYALCFLVAWIPQVLRAETRAGAWRKLGFGALSAAAILLLYLPWLPAMLTRYQVDRSYWHGSLKLGEALRHIAVSYTTGAPETMLEGNAVRLLPWFGLVLGIALVALLVWRWKGVGEDGPAVSLYLFLALVVPIVAVLVLSWRTPKFNPRYLMLASPAYLLILGGGIGALLGPARPARPSCPWHTGQGGTRAREPVEGPTADGPEHHAAGSTQSATRSALPVVRILAGLVLVAFLVVVSWLSIHNWFTDPAFSKAQWRELAADVRAQLAPNEAVLLVSGHAWPAWEFYASDIPAVRLPDLDILDVDAVLGFEAGSTLSRALKDKSGVWLVSWQAEAVDPAGFVPYFLDRAGKEKSVKERFWQLGLRHWELPKDASYPPEPQPSHADRELANGANYAHQIAFLGWDDPKGDQITVYWRALNPISRDYQVSLVLEDAAGREVGRWDGRPAGYQYPTYRWRPGQALFGRYTLPLPPGAPDGDYYVTLALYDASDPSGLDIMDVADNPAGKRVRIGPIRVER